MVHARQASSAYAWLNQLDIVFLLSLFRGLWVATSGGAVLSSQFEAVQTGMEPEAPASTGSTSPPGGGSILSVSSSGQYSPLSHTPTFISVQLVWCSFHSGRRRDWCPSAEERSDVSTRAQCRGQGATPPPVVCGAELGDDHVDLITFS